jgi:hypothetical protein
MTTLRSSPDEADDFYYPRWANILGVLGLDLAKDSFPSLGLTGFDEAAIRASSRRGTEKARDPSVDVETAVTGFVTGCFEEVLALSGAAHLTYFQAWGDEVYQYESASGAQVLFWSTLLIKGSAATRPPLVDRLRAELEQLPLFRVLRTPESDWDIDYYQRHDYAIVGSPQPPIHELSNTIAHVRFLRAWRSATAITPGEDELAEVSAWALRACPSVGLEERMLKPLQSLPQLPTLRLD